MIMPSGTVPSEAVISETMLSGTMLSGPLMMAVYFIFFSAVHSLLADPAPKRMARGFFGAAADRWYRLAFTVLSLIIVLPFFYILLFWSGRVLYSIPPPGRWLMISGQALAALGLLLATMQTGIAQFLGLAQLQGRTKEGGLVRSGLYCHLRNPQFFFGIIFLWLFYTMTLSLFVFNLLATIYFYLGARHEERSLIELFGKEYEEYRRTVPMFIPRLKCK